jgi:hypothetical protein
LWGSEFTTKAAKLQGGSSEFVPSLCVVGIGPDVTRARGFVHEVTRAEELAERRRARSADCTGLEVYEHLPGVIVVTHLPPEASC